MSTTEMDWSVLQLPGVEEVARNAARQMAREYEGYVEYDDAVQDGLMRLAGMPGRVRECVEGADRATLGTLKHELYRDLQDAVKTAVAHRTNTIPYQRLEAVEL